MDKVEILATTTEINKTEELKAILNEKLLSAAVAANIQAEESEESMHTMVTVVAMLGGSVIFIAFFLFMYRNISHSSSHSGWISGAGASGISSALLFEKLLPRVMIKRRESTLRAVGGDGDVDSENPITELKALAIKGFVPRLRGGGSLLSESDAIELVKYLPFTLQSKDFYLLFATEQHGYNLQNAYRKATDQGPWLLVGMDTNRFVFAAFCSDSLQKHGSTFYGNGQCFVATITPTFQVFRASVMDTASLPMQSFSTKGSRATPESSASESLSGPEAYQFVITTDDMIGFGGKKFALWLDSSFEKGTSEVSPTYNNSCLASNSTFKCVAVEIYGFTNPLIQQSIPKMLTRGIKSILQ